jgi:prepilin-type N-terminal cleavage/methylation domain-containing protein
MEHKPSRRIHLMLFERSFSNHALIRLHAFTLSELLISLSVLGLISALTLPSIFNSVNDAKKKAVFKESINAVSAAINQVAMNGEVYTNDLTLFKEKLNAKECSNNLTITAPFGVNDKFGCVLHNGAYLTNLNNTTTRYVSLVYLDWNGNDHPNLSGNDRTFFLVNWGSNTAVDMDISGSVLSLSGFTPKGSMAPGEIAPTVFNTAEYQSLFK